MLIIFLFISTSSSLRVKGIRIHVFDEYKVLPQKTKNIADKMQNLTRMNSKIVVNLVIGFPRKRINSYIVTIFHSNKITLVNLWYFFSSYIFKPHSYFLARKLFPKQLFQIQLQFFFSLSYFCTYLSEGPIYLWKDIRN